jgi:hypothetical protein
MNSLASIQSSSSRKSIEASFIHDTVASRKKSVEQVAAPIACISRENLGGVSRTTILEREGNHVATRYRATSTQTHAKTANGPSAGERDESIAAQRSVLREGEIYVSAANFKCIAHGAHFRNSICCQRRLFEDFDWVLSAGF